MQTLLQALALVIIVSGASLPALAQLDMPSETSQNKKQFSWNPFKHKGSKVRKVKVEHPIATGRQYKTSTYPTSSYPTAGKRH